MISLLPGWEHLAQPPGTAPDPVRPNTAAEMPVADRVATEQEISTFAAMLSTGAIAAIGIRAISCRRRPTVTLRSGASWTDIRSLEPACVALAALHGGPTPHQVTCAAVDPRRPNGLMVLAKALGMAVPFVMHDAKPVLFALWTLGLAAPTNLFDTAVAARCLHLGRHHVRALRHDTVHQIGDEQALRLEKEHHLSLQGQCAHYGLGFPYSSSDTDGSLDDLTINEPIASATVRRAVCDAQWALRLCHAQQVDLVANGIHHHLHSVEFPFTIANARIEWHGVPVSVLRLRQLAVGAGRAADHYAQVLRSHGVEPAGSRDRFLDVMQRLGLAAHLTRDGQWSTKDSVLESVEHLHPAIRAFRLHARYQRLTGEEWLAGALLGADGRLHPRHTQLGAATGRNSCSSPNLAGIGRTLRPVVTAPEGRALVELDYAQIEVGVAAAHHNDPDLIAAYNSGDVYAAMAQRFYRDDLTPFENELPAAVFKRHRPELRDRIKTFVLAVLYNIQPPSIAVRFGISVARATAERDRFLGLYPWLRAGLEADSQIGMARGYATIVSGLRRHVPASAVGTQWCRNFLRNTPIQGSAAVVFKKAIVLLDTEFAGTTTKIVLPAHDSVLIECDRQAVDDVCERAAALMRHALRHYYPQLQPRIDVNKIDVTCWNKDGRSDSLERFLADPETRIEGCGAQAQQHHCAAMPMPALALSGAPFRKLMNLVGGAA